MIATTVVNGLLPLDLPFNPLWLGGGAAWLAATLLFVDTTLALKLQVSAILLAGIGLILFADARGAPIDPDFIISSSTGLMTMIASVGFLRLVVIPDTRSDERLPVGPGAYLRTLLGLNIASSIINISAPLLISDRIHDQRPLDRLTAQSFVRVFCGVSSWSPFFGAMAVVLTYVADARLLWVIVAGFPFMLVGLVGVYIEARLRFAQDMRSFVGYPTHLEALRVPALLVLVTLIAAQLLPAAPILVLISISALLVTLVVLLARRGLQESWQRLGGHVSSGLPRIVNELCLFLAAGVLAAGIAALIGHGVFANPFSEFDALSAVELLALIVAAGMLGIHPIVSISSVSSMILGLDPNPELLAATFLFGWHLGTCASPLSGTNLVFQGRYGIPSWQMAFWNWPYALAMLAVAALWLPLVNQILLRFS